MPILRFTGRILPPAFTLTVANYPRLNVWDYKKQADVGTIDVSINDHEIDVVVNVDEINEESETTASRNANDIIDAIVSLTSFQTGMGFGFILDKMHYEDGRSFDLAIEDPHLAKLATALGSEAEVDAIFRLVANDKALFLALRDLAETITRRHSAFINFARAIETIRNDFIPEGGDREDGWEPMRESLNLSENFIRKITNASRGPRHGDRKWMQPSHRLIQEMAWQVMNRFLEYRKRGNQPLPISDFPLLDC